MFKDKNQAKTAMHFSLVSMQKHCRTLYAGNEMLFKSELLKNKIHRLEMEILGLDHELNKELTLTYSVYKEL